MGALPTIKKLQKALNQRGCRVLYSTSQFYSEAQQRPVTCYHIKQATYDSLTDKTVSKEIFKTYSQVQVLLFLRDMWYDLNGQEVPTDNEMWNQAKKKYYENLEE